MVPLESLDAETIKFIQEAPFCHYYLLWVVHKEDSISTPVQLVVDPTMSGLNVCMAKGENRIGSLVDILLRNRTLEYAWTYVTKHYNQLHLERSALPYSLFLYSDELNHAKKPATFVMKVAWYGVVPAGNQAGYALELLVESNSKEFPEAVDPLTRHRYGDDVVSGAGSPNLSEAQIAQSVEVLARGGFKFKHVIKSGEDPPEGASTDGESCKKLGYKWNPSEDYLAPGLGELNFNPKVRGAKVPNSKPVTEREEARDLIKKVTLTQQTVVARIAELFDPVGLLEPLKLQLKLHLSRLNGKPWKEPLSEEEGEFWSRVCRLP